MKIITYQEILEKVNIPIMSDEGINQLLNWYLSGKRLPSRSIKLKDHREPDAGEYDPEFYADQQIIVIYQIIKLIKKDLWQLPYPTLIEKYISCNWFSKKFKLSMAELAKLSNASIQEIKALINSDPENPYRIFLERIRANCAAFDEEHIGDCFSFPYDPKINYQGRFAKGYEFRIYLNGPNDNSRYEFLSIYIQKCIAYGIPFHMKGSGALASDIDNMILYTNSNCLTKNLAVLEEIKEERPDLIAKFGSPIATGDVSSYYAVTHAGKKGLNGTFFQTYNDYFDFISELAYLSLLSEEALTDNKIPYYAYSEIAKEYSISVNDVYAIINKYQTISPLIIDKYNIPRNEREIINKLCHSYCSDTSKLDNFASKYEAKIKTIASIYNFGNKEHTDFPVCFDNIFYKALIAEKIISNNLVNPNEYHFKGKEIIQDNEVNILK